MAPVTGIDWAKVKRRQAREFDTCGNVASGIGEHGVANACWRGAAVLRNQAKTITDLGTAAGDGNLGPSRAALLGKRVLVKLDAHLIQEGTLLGFGEGGDFQLRSDDGLIHFCWPGLDVEEAPERSTDGQ